MKKILLLIVFLGASNLFAQQQDSILENKISKLEVQVNKQEQDINQISLELDKDYWTYRGVKKEIQEKIIQQKYTIDSLNSLIDEGNQKLERVNNNLDSKIQQTGEKANYKILKLDSSLDKTRLYWIIATMGMLLLGGLIYWLLGKRMRSNKHEVENQIQSSITDVETQIKNTKTALEEEGLKLDGQLLGIINTQLKIKESEDSNLISGEKDHSLVLKVADEVTKILMNLEVMDKNIKGYKHLKKYSESILDNLKAYGYEIPKLIGQSYNSGMNMVATLEFDDSIDENKQIIKRIIKPQVNYNNKAIQTAKVIVAFNE